MLQVDHALSEELISRFDELLRETGSALRDLMGAETFSEYWLGDIVLRAGAPPPELRNTDGEAVAFCEVRFPLAGDRAELAAGLAAGARGAAFGARDRPGPGGIRHLARHGRAGDGGAGPSATTSSPCRS